LLSFQLLLLNRLSLLLSCGRQTPVGAFLLACNANRSWFLMNSFVYYKLITVKTIHGVNGPEIPYFSGVFLKTLAEMSGLG
jgi:hypothetical protein